MNLFKHWKPIAGVVVLLLFLLFFYIFSIDPTIYSTWSSSYVHSAALPIPIILTIEISILTFIIGVNIYYAVEQYKLSIRGFNDLAAEIVTFSVYSVSIKHTNDEKMLKLICHIEALLPKIFKMLAYEINLEFTDEIIKNVQRKKVLYSFPTESQPLFYFTSKLAAGIKHINNCCFDDKNASQMIATHQNIFKHVNAIRGYTIARQPEFLYNMLLFLAIIVYITCIPLFLALYSWTFGIIAILLNLFIIVVVIDGPRTINPIFSKDTQSFVICNNIVNDSIRIIKHVLSDSKNKLLDSC